MAAEYDTMKLQGTGPDDDVDVYLETTGPVDDVDIYMETAGPAEDVDVYLDIADTALCHERSNSTRHQSNTAVKKYEFNEQLSKMTDKYFAQQFQVNLTRSKL